MALNRTHENTVPSAKTDLMRSAPSGKRQMTDCRPAFPSKTPDKRPLLISTEYPITSFPVGIGSAWRSRKTRGGTKPSGIGAVTFFILFRTRSSFCRVPFRIKKQKHAKHTAGQRHPHLSGEIIFIFLLFPASSSAYRPPSPPA